jgi:uncharacterized protein (TIGR02145 family)
MRPLLILLFTIVKSINWAQIPNLLTHQGIARNTEGIALQDSSLTFKFSIIDNLNEAAIWEEIHVTVTDGTGHFKVLLGSINPLPEFEFNNEHYSLITEINSGNSFSPIGQSRLLHVPYALQTNISEHSQDGFDYISTTGDTLFLEDGRFILIPNISSHNLAGPIQTGITDHSCDTTDIHNPSVAYGITHDIDGNSYRTVKIGELTWMAENLRVTHYSNGDEIPIFYDNDFWYDSDEGMFFYANSDYYRCLFGGYYNWYTVNDSRKLCPTGWRVASLSDWTLLFNIVGRNTAAQRYLKSNALNSSGNSMWLSFNPDELPINNYFGFSVLPSGVTEVPGNTGTIGYSAKFWSSDRINNGTAWSANFTNSSAIPNGSQSLFQGLSVRCVKNTD